VIFVTNLENIITIQGSLTHPIGAWSISIAYELLNSNKHRPHTSCIFTIKHNDLYILLTQ
jgi:hypothetical protein